MKTFEHLFLMGGLRRVQMGGLVAWVGCMGGLRDGVGMGGVINIT
jgi:hypothetical protein